MVASRTEGGAWCQTAAANICSKKDTFNWMEVLIWMTSGRPC